MSGPQEIPLEHYLDADDMLLVIRPGTSNRPEIFLAMQADGTVRAFSGHVDLGTGIRIALAQIVAEELDIAVERVEMVLGTTSAAPDQGPTIASETIQVTAIPLRQAAATARFHLLAQAAALKGMDADALTVTDGVISSGAWSLPYADLIAGSHVRVEIDPTVRVKSPDEYRIVGRSQQRNDIKSKALGDWTYVHDVRVAGMLHGRVIRPPHAGFDHGELVGKSLVAIDERSVAEIPGLVAVVTDGDFVGVVATREENAVEAMRRLKVIWREQPPRPDLNRVEEALRGNPREKTRLLKESGDVETALAGAQSVMQRTYVWPYQMHGSIGPSCAVADWQDGKLIVWSGTQNPHWMRRDLALLMSMPEEEIVVERFEAAGCYGRNCADDVTADAALLSRAVGRPVRVQLTREQEHGWEPKGAGQVIDVRGGIDLEGGPAAYDFETRYPSNLAPTLALVLTGKVTGNETVEMGDRTAIPPYAIGNMRIQVHDMPPIARASWFRGVSAMPNSFAHESFIDELAAAAKVDPIEYRLRYLTDNRAIDLVRAVVEKAAWTPRTRWGTEGGEGDLLYGRGFAYALYVHGKFPGVPAAWSAWVADVAVNRKTGVIAVTRITVGQDTGMMVNPEGVRHQIHGNVIQSISRVLKEKVDFSATQVESVEWGGYPILTFPELPDIDVLMLPRQNEEPRGAGESASVPSAAAIVNAVYDATGIRFRELPLTPDKVLEALGQQPEKRLPQPAAKARRPILGLGLSLAGLAGLATSGLALLSPIKSAIPEIARPDPTTFSQATIERGRLAAAAGACNVCHVGADGTAFAGGRAFETPFGTVYAANISADTATGIGAWSYPAFERAMRQGVHRDGSHLYPVHPYTSFAKADEADIQALYAYLMAEPAAANTVADSRLTFPFNIRGLMAGWNALYLKPTSVTDASRSSAWNRGAYLVESLGHCSACHSARNAVGAELGGAAHLAGGFADGWEAPALRGPAQSPVGWTQDALYSYLRQGYAHNHGAANGPMRDVVKSLQPLPDEDIRAMAVYLSDGVRVDADAARTTALDAARAAEAASALTEPSGARLFEGACSACHADGTPLASLALNTNLHSDRPDNLLQVILNGADAPAALARHASAEQLEVMSMPAFRQSFSDRQLSDLAAYLRARFAPGKAPWAGLKEAAERVRVAGH
jgi:nicotinate dehydrogenase subunit B